MCAQLFYTNVSQLIGWWFVGGNVLHVGLLMTGTPLSLHYNNGWSCIMSVWYNIQCLSDFTSHTIKLICGVNDT